MRTFIEQEVDQDKCLYLTNFDRLPLDIYTKAERFESENCDRCYKAIEEILRPLPISQKFRYEEWYTRYYLNDLTAWILSFRAIESIEPLLRKEKEIENISIFLQHCKYRLEEDGVDTSRDTEELNLKKLRYSELDFDTLKYIFKKRFRHTCENSSEKGIDNFLKKIIPKRLFHNLSRNPYNRGRFESGFKKTLVICLVETVKDYFKGDRYFNNFRCDPCCNLIGTQDCLFMKDRSMNSKTDCPHNKKQIQWLKKWQKEISTDGYIPEIAYLLAKVGILEIKECNLRGDSCRESDCLLKKRINNCVMDKNNKLVAFLQSQGMKLLCDKDSKNINCNECISEVRKELGKRLNESRKSNPPDEKETETIKFKDISLRTQWLNVPLILDEIKTQAKKNIDSLSNPCPRATKQVYEFIAEHKKRRSLIWKSKNKIEAKGYEMHNRISYAKVYLKAKNRTEKKKLLGEISRLSGIRNKNTILQNIRRTIKKNPDIFKSQIQR